MLRQRPHHPHIFVLQGTSFASYLGHKLAGYAGDALHLAGGHMSLQGIPVSSFGPAFCSPSGIHVLLFRSPSPLLSRGWHISVKGKQQLTGAWKSRGLEEGVGRRGGERVPAIETLLACVPVYLLHCHCNSHMA